MATNPLYAQLQVTCLRIIGLLAPPETVASTDILECIYSAMGRWPDTPEMLQVAVRAFGRFNPTEAGLHRVTAAMAALPMDACLQIEACQVLATMAGTVYGRTVLATDTRVRPLVRAARQNHDKVHTIFRNTYAVFAEPL